MQILPVDNFLDFKIFLMHHFEKEMKIRIVVHQVALNFINKHFFYQTYSLLYEYLFVFTERSAVKS